MLQEGFTLEQALTRTKFFPKRVLVYVNTGEATGSLDECFGRLSRALYEEAMFRFQVLVGLIEPLAILGLGGLIVFGLAGS